MVNHCVNILRLEKRNSKDIKLVLQPFLSDSGNLDFNKVIEMPSDLKRSMKPLEKACENPKSSIKYIKKLESKIKSKNLEDWGFETPEDWARENWGPEFNCYNFYWDTVKNSATFDTASDPPLHIICEIAQKTKQNLVLFYAEPGDRKYGELHIDAQGNSSLKDYSEETIPKEFHKEFPDTYPPQKNKRGKSKASVKKDVDNPTLEH
jgi:hypothetical protein